MLCIISSTKLLTHGVYRNAFNLGRQQSLPLITMSESFMLYFLSGTSPVSDLSVGGVVFWNSAIRIRIAAAAVEGRRVE